MALSQELCRTVVDLGLHLPLGPGRAVRLGDQHRAGPLDECSTCPPEHPRLLGRPAKRLGLRPDGAREAHDVGMGKRFPLQSAPREGHVRPLARPREGLDAPRRQGLPGVHAGQERVARALLAGHGVPRPRRHPAAPWRQKLRALGLRPAGPDQRLGPEVPANLLGAPLRRHGADDTRSRSGHRPGRQYDERARGGEVFQEAPSGDAVEGLVERQRCADPPPREI
mmetsp:Transcript_76358/g.247679  ORF Transcript_76358/g.247679 Transcript_76358/m.247679 type:complete len:225 (+) Transcript_76358:885-1559(+)